MELAGLSVAEAVYRVLPSSNILLVCGPGNNGGDGLVAARHLTHFGCRCTVLLPKPPKTPHFANLLAQCRDLGISVVSSTPKEAFDVVVDAVFGFSFRGVPREPYASALEAVGRMGREGALVVSVDVPSGWDVDAGDVAGTGFVPDALVSLTAPKGCARSFTGRHFVGGRFLPPGIAERYGVKMPPYEGVSQVMETTPSCCKDE